MIQSRKDANVIESNDSKIENEKSDQPSPPSSAPQEIIPSNHLHQDKEETASSPIPTLEKLKESVIRALRLERHSLAAAMEKSEHWDLKENTLSLTFNSPFESTFIEKEGREIENLIFENLGWRIRIITVIKDKEEDNSTEELGEQVELIRTVFRGTIIKRS